MGHEYVEMKNSHAAIEAYRKAVGASLSRSGWTCAEFAAVISYLDVNRKDYRAWYGLGQAYELLSMHQYALYYYQHATALRYVLGVLSSLRRLCVHRLPLLIVSSFLFVSNV